MSVRTRSVLVSLAACLMVLGTGCQGDDDPSAAPDRDTESETSPDATPTPSGPPSKPPASKPTPSVAPGTCGRVTDPMTSRTVEVSVEQGRVDCDKALSVVRAFFEKIPPTGRLRAGSPPQVAPYWWCGLTAPNGHVRCFSGLNAGNEKYLDGAWVR